MKKVAILICMALILSSIVLSVYAMSSIDTDQVEIAQIDEFSPKMNVDLSFKSFLNDVIDAIKDSPEIYGFSHEQLDDIEVSSPYRILQYNENKLSVMSKISYFVKSGEEIKGVATLAKYNDEYLWDFSTELVEVYTDIIKTEDTFVLIADDSKLWILTSDNTKRCLVDYSRETMHSNVSRTNDDEIGFSDNHDINFQLCQPYSVDSNNFSLFNIFVKTNENQTDASRMMRSITPAYMDQNTPNWHYCHNACIASIVKTRLPNDYNNLDGIAVQNTTGMNYFLGNKEFIATNMKNYYLPTPNHKISYHTTSYTLEQFKNNCDDDHIMIDISYIGDVSNNVYHCVVTYDYTNSSSGGILVKFMDPNTASYRMQNWVTGNFKFYPNSTATSYLESQQMVISWY